MGSLPGLERGLHQLIGRGEFLDLLGEISFLLSVIVPEIAQLDAQLPFTSREPVQLRIGLRGDSLHMLLVLVARVEPPGALAWQLRVLADGGQRIGCERLRAVLHGLPGFADSAGRVQTVLTGHEPTLGAGACVRVTDVDKGLSLSDAFGNTFGCVRGVCPPVPCRHLLGAGRGDICGHAGRVPRRHLAVVGSVLAGASRRRCFTRAAAPPVSAGPTQR